jgi:transcriptional regulator with XRE-family HTH domain
MASRRLPNYLRTFRKRTGLSQEEVAFLLGCQSGNKASRYERRTRKPNLETILAYELVFGAPARELFAGIFDDVADATLKRAQALAEKLKQNRANLLIAQKLETLEAINSGEGRTPPQTL